MSKHYFADCLACGGGVFSIEGDPYATMCPNCGANLERELTLVMRMPSPVNKLSFRHVVLMVLSWVWFWVLAGILAYQVGETVDTLLEAMKMLMSIVCLITGIVMPMLIFSKVYPSRYTT